MPDADLNCTQSLTWYLTLAQLSKYFFEVTLVVVPPYFQKITIVRRVFGKRESL